MKSAKKRSSLISSGCLRQPIDEKNKNYARLLDLLREKSYEKRKVVLSSGRTSDFYIDVRQTALHPEGMTLLGTLIFERLTQGGEQVAAVGGMTMGADPLSIATAMVSYQAGQPLASFFVRKEP